MNILLGVCGSISAYKSCDITSELIKKGHNVKIILTDGATKFVTPLSLQALSKNYVHTTFEENVPSEIQHIQLSKWADIFVIAPATANIIGKIANGISDDLLSCTAMVVTCRKLIAPAMNIAMYQNNIVTSNIKKLINNEYKEIQPRESLLACGDFGQGALATVEDILKAIESYNRV